MAINFDKPPAIIHPFKFSANDHKEYIVLADGRIVKVEDHYGAGLPGMFGSMFVAGSRAEGSYIYSVSAANQNLFTKAGSPIVAGDYTFTINASVIISSSTTATASLITGGFPTGSIIYLVNNGSIYGKGGKGGDGGFGQDGFAGVIGGDALSLGNNLTITNASGQIFGGGGGGGGGAYLASGPFPQQRYGGGGGGSGAGTSSTTGGAGGVVAGTSGTAGGTGSGTTAGSGGLGGLSNDGGAGGGSGAAGTAGVNTDNAGGTAGAAGKAINKNGFTTTYISGNDSTHVKGVQT